VAVGAPPPALPATGLSLLPPPSLFDPPEALPSPCGRFLPSLPASPPRSPGGTPCQDDDMTLFDSDVI